MDADDQAPTDPSLSKRPTSTQDVSLPSSSTTPTPSSQTTNPPALLILGMAGSGKSTLSAALQTHFPKPYLINLDPAVINPPFSPNIDIQDTIKHSTVMRDYNLGPNGAILTSLNLFATRFDQVLDLLSQRSKEISHIVLDTPGQIETFTWSASGDIISNALASQHVTIVLYVIDTVRSSSPMTFISNMLHACSIMYKTRLPMILVFSKWDACEGEKGKVVKGWLTDFEEFEKAIGEDMGFRGTLARSMALALSEFYEEVRSVGVSSMTGEGLDVLERLIGEGREEFLNEFLPVVEERKRKRDEAERRRIVVEMEKLKLDRKGEKVLGRKKEMEMDPKEDEKEYEEFVKDIERLNAGDKQNGSSSANGSKVEGE